MLNSVHLVRIYPTGQNDSLELMFVKFAPAKNREKLNPLKVSSDRCYLPENNPKDVKNCSVNAPQLRFKPSIHRLQILHSMTEL